MSFKAEFLKQIIGKSISGIVLTENTGSGPRYQIFVIFTDNTYLEFYGDMSWATHLETGNIETVRQYAARFGGKVIVIN